MEKKTTNSKSYDSPTDHKSRAGTNTRKKLLFAVFILMDIALAAVLISLFLQRSDRQFEQELRQLGATIYPQAVQLQQFTLTDQFGQTFNHDNLLGKWTLVFFGFTSCPDICPLTMNELAQFSNSLQSTNFAKDTEIVLVTVDPKRDSDQVMADYLTLYNEDFIGLNGETQQIAQLAEELYVNFSDSYAATTHQQEDPLQTTHSDHDTVSDNQQLNDHAEFTVNHSAHIAVINPQGNYHSVLRAPHRDQDILTAYTMIRERSGDR